MNFGNEKIMYKASDIFPQERKESGNRVQKPSKTNVAEKRRSMIMKQDPKRSMLSMSMLSMSEIENPRTSRYAKKQVICSSSRNRLHLSVDLRGLNLNILKRPMLPRHCSPLTNPPPPIIYKE